MMAVPGFSVTELLQATNKAKQIYDAFRDEYDRAPARIKEVVDTCNYLHRVLQDCQSLLHVYGEVCPQVDNSSRKLDECDAFIQKYRSLKPGTQHSNAVHTSSNNTCNVWQTTRLAFDDQTARDLKDGLQLEIQKLLLFIVVFAM